MYGWQHRFDDLQRKYRTLYCANERITCLYEVLADLRPNTAALAEWARLFGADGAEEILAAGFVSWSWREKNTLGEALVRTSGELVDLDDVAVRRDLESRHAALLAEHEMPHLDITQVRSKDRIVTQTISRSLFEQDFAGVCFRSNLDDRECFALFEGRAWLEGMGAQLPLTDDVPELLQVASDFRLVLERVAS